MILFTGGNREAELAGRRGAHITMAAAGIKKILNEKLYAGLRTIGVGIALSGAVKLIPGLFPAAAPALPAQGFAVVDFTAGIIALLFGLVILILASTKPPGG